ncbi:hypothetical protein J6590_022292 [Homalodisca vitripennis]|nr:hypothetical protein J6590_022292 [Homalodisca vitripennis]
MIADDWGEDLNRNHYCQGNWQSQEDKRLELNDVVPVITHYCHNNAGPDPRFRLPSQRQGAVLYKVGSEVTLPPPATRHENLKELCSFHSQLSVLNSDILTILTQFGNQIEYDVHEDSSGSTEMGSRPGRPSRRLWCNPLSAARFHPPTRR